MCTASVRHRAGECATRISHPSAGRTHVIYARITIVINEQGGVHRMGGGSSIIASYSWSRGWKGFKGRQV